MGTRSARPVCSLNARVGASLALAFGLVAGPAGPAAGQASPDRYDLAKGCWAVRSEASGGFLARDDGGYAAIGPDLAGAEAFHLEPTELGIYLLYGSAEDFLGRNGEATEVEPTPSTQAEWIIDAHSAGGFTLHNLSTGDGLQSDADGNLVVGDAGSAGVERQFAFVAHTGCAVWPEVDVNVTGTPLAGATTTTEVVGIADAHLHHMGFRFLGGGAHCGQPWHRYGVTHALVDCPDHEGNGAGAVLENFLRTGQPTGTHDPVGWPTFADWPAPDSLTHEQTYWRWMERAWRGGLRMYVQLNVENAALCDIYPIKARLNCNEMDSVRLQLQDIRDLENYIDAQYGGPGEGFLRIVTDPFEAREVMNDGKLAVILGIEVSALFDCKLLSGQPTCTTDDIDAQLQEMWDAGVRQMELTNKFDNALSGVAGDAGALGILVNAGQFEQSGRFWDMRPCELPEGVAEEEFHDHDKPQENLGEFPEQDAIFGAVSDLYGSGAPAPIYADPPHCNALGLSDLGRHTIDGLMQKRVLIDPDHMSVLARREALEHIDAAGYEGVLSSHSWSTPEAYEKILEMGGFIAAIPGSNTAGYVADWQDARGWRDDRYFFGFGYGADNNGFANQPRNIADFLDGKAVTYPYTGLGGVTVEQQVSGERVYDVNLDGVAHYGLYPDWWEALRLGAGPDIVADMQRSAEAYLQTWERAWGIAGDACRVDVPDLSRAQVEALEPGTLWIDVLEAVGQPNQRFEQFYTHCVEGGVTATLEFDADDRLVGRTFSAGAAPVLGAPTPAAPGLPATGGGAVVGGLLALGAAGTGLLHRTRRRR